MYKRQREHFELARRFRSVYSKYERGRDLVQIGAYAHGSDPGLDEAIVLHDGMGNFLQQDMFEAASFASSLESMEMATQHNV